MRALLVVVILSLTACVDELSSVDQAVCTEEDQQNGNCGDGGGGGPPATLPLPETTQNYASAILASQYPGWQPISHTDGCHTVVGGASGPSHACHVRLNFGSWELNVDCFQYTDGSQVCASTICTPTPTGSVCG